MGRCRPIYRFSREIYRVSWDVVGGWEALILYAPLKVNSKASSAVSHDVHEFFSHRREKLNCPSRSGRVSRNSSTPSATYHALLYHSRCRCTTPSCTILAGEVPRPPMKTLGRVFIYPYAELMCYSAARRQFITYRKYIYSRGCVCMSF